VSLGGRKWEASRGALSDEIVYIQREVIVDRFQKKGVSIGDRDLGKDCLDRL